MRPGAGRRRTRRRSGDRVIHRDPGGGRPAPHRADQHRARVRRRGPSAHRAGDGRDDARGLGRDDGSDRRPSGRPGRRSPQRPRPRRGRRRVADRLGDLHGHRTARRAGNDSTRAVFTSGCSASSTQPDQLQLLLDDPVARARRGRGALALLPRVLPLPADRAARGRAARADDPGGRQGAALVRVRQSATRRSTRTPSAST